MIDIKLRQDLIKLLSRIPTLIQHEFPTLTEDIYTMTTRLINENPATFIGQFLTEMGIEVNQESIKKTEEMCNEELNECPFCGNVTPAVQGVRCVEYCCFDMYSLFENLSFWEKAVIGRLAEAGVQDAKGSLIDTVRKIVKLASLNEPPPRDERWKDALEKSNHILHEAAQWCRAVNPHHHPLDARAIRIQEQIDRNHEVLSLSS